MKKRIIALSLVVVMAVLSLVSCFGAYDCAETDFVGEGYATFDSAKFDAGLKNIVIKDGDFTADAAEREKYLMQSIYKSVADAIVKSAFESERLTAGDLDDHDILYFVYYAVDENEGTAEKPNPNKGKVYFSADMKESAITASTTKDNHTVILGTIDLEDEDADEFMKKIKENLFDRELTVEDFYAMTTDIPLTEKEGDVEPENKYDLKDGDIIYVSYSESYKQEIQPAEGSEGGEKQYESVKKTVEYRKLVIDLNDEFCKKLVKGETEFKLGEGDDEHSFTSVKPLWLVEEEGTPISFKYTPYTASKKVKPDVYTADQTTVELKDVELTYYVYPVYYYEAPSAEELKADPSLLLEEVLASKLTVDSFEVFDDEEYKFEGTKLADIVKKVSELLTPVVNTTDESKTGDYYKAGTDLRNLYDKHAEAVKAGGEEPTTAQQDAIDTAKENLTKKQNEELKVLVNKIVYATKGEGENAVKAGDEIWKEHWETQEHSEVEKYNTDITEKVQQAVWDLIDDAVVIKGYPEKLLKEFVEHLYDQYEYSYYNESQSTGAKLAYYDAYESLEAYIRSSDCLNVPATKEADLDVVVENKAKTYIDPIIKIYVVSQYVADSAVAALPAYIEHDIANGGYDVDKDAYIEKYGEEYGTKRYDEDVKEIEEIKASAREEATKFIIDDDYIKDYKKEIGNAAYRDTVETYGEINIRASLQFNKLFYYLTSTNIQRSNAGGHNHYEPAYVTREGKNYIDFRNVTYTFEAPEADADESK